MPASIRIIKIMKDKNPVSGEEIDDYTVEFECIADDSAKLAQELSKCPLGERVMTLLDRAKFLPEETPTNAEQIKQEAEEEEKARLEHEEELREEGRKEVREKYIDFLKKKRLGKRTTEALENLDEKENEEKTEEEGAHQNDHEREDRFPIVSRGGPRGFIHDR